ncbi:MAG: hypothetical protein ACTHNH_20335 [Mesorhizobium sp.]
MRLRTLAALASVAVLVGCESTTNTHWEKIGYGPTLDYAEAQCRIMAMGTQQGVIAWGSPGYVAGAQLGNAIGNAIREAEFMKNCMTMQGWKRMPNAPQQVKATTASHKTNISSLLNQWASWNNQCVAGKKSACQARNTVGAQLAKMGVHPGV